MEITVNWESFEFYNGLRAGITNKYKLYIIWEPYNQRKENGKEVKTIKPQYLGKTANYATKRILDKNSGLF